MTLSVTACPVVTAAAAAGLERQTLRDSPAAPALGASAAFKPRSDCQQPFANETRWTRTPYPEPATSIFDTCNQGFGVCPDES